MPFRAVFLKFRCIFVQIRRPLWGLHRADSAKSDVISCSCVHKNPPCIRAAMTGFPTRFRAAKQINSDFISCSKTKISDVISCTHLLTTKPGSSLPMPRTDKSTISCVSSSASKGTPCDAENDRFCGKCGKLDESHVSFLRQKSNSLPVFSRLPALLKADSGCFRMHRRMFYCTVQSRICSKFSLIFVFGRMRFAARRKVGIRTVSSFAGAAPGFLPRCLSPRIEMRESAVLAPDLLRIRAKSLFVRSEIRLILRHNLFHSDIFQPPGWRISARFRWMFPNLPME